MTIEEHFGYNKAIFKDFLKIMRLSTIFLLAGISTVSAHSTYSQSVSFTLEKSEITLRQLFDEIERQSEFIFFYQVDALEENRQVNISVKNRSIESILDGIFAGTDNIYTIDERQIYISRKPSAIEQQNKIRVTGIITDPSNGAVIGASIIEKGVAGNGTVSDVNGNFSLNVTPGATLVVSYIGYKTQEIAVGNQTLLKIKISEETANLEEIVIVGYGTMRKSDVTGSITQIGSEDLLIAGISNPVQAIQGRAPGVAVMTANGPGSTPSIRIRGSGSIDAGSEPLYVVDGFPLMDNDLNAINPNDIESIEILKDASSTAIYGSRGSNGVIMVTTKSGSKGRNNLNINAYTGVQTPDRLPEMISGQTFIDFINEGYTYKTGKPIYDAAHPAPAYNTDWQREIISSHAWVSDYSLSFNGGNDATSYLISAGIYSQEGIIASSGFDRYTFRTNLSHVFRPWLTVGTHLQATHSVRNRRDNPTANIFRWGWPTFPVKNPDGSWYYAKDDPYISTFLENRWNPVSESYEVEDKFTTDRLLGDVFAEFSFLNRFKFKTNFGYDLSNIKNYNYSTSQSVGNYDKKTGSGGQSHNKSETKISENILTFSNEWDKHRLTATGVYSWQSYYFESMSLSGSGFSEDITGAHDMSKADPQSITFATDKYSSVLQSYTARLSYSYDYKYLLTVTGRYDGSSRFGENNKWGFFPSIGIGWRVEQEPFMESLRKIFTSAKLRASYGATGNQEIGNYQSLPKLTSARMIYNDIPLEGYYETIGNSNLKWERALQLDLGLDLILLNRLDLALDYYNRKTSNLLYSVPIPSTSGYVKMLSNIGGVTNEGIEFNLKYKIFDDDIKWSVGGNISRNVNKITELYGNVESVNLGESSNGMAKYLKVGDPVTGIWGRESAGIIRTAEQLAEYQKTVPSAQLGEEMYVDQNNDNRIDADDYICWGSTVPNFIYGLSSHLTYKGFGLDIYGQGAYDYTSDASIDNSKFGSSAIGFASSTDNYLFYGENQILSNVHIPTVYAYERMWREDNPDGTFPRAGAKGVYFSDRTHAHWNYFIMKNIVVSYDFSKLFRKENIIKNLKVSFNVQNPFSFTNHRGYNPENGDVTYPWIRSYTLGINANF
jgi:TonB-linked SusC/RagA family outer membrane protein